MLKAILTGAIGLSLLFNVAVLVVLIINEPLILVGIALLILVVCCGGGSKREKEVTKCSTD